MITTTLRLPFPLVSGNHYIETNYRQRRKYVTKKGIAYRKMVFFAVKREGLTGLPITGKVNVTLTVTPPDRRRRDKDNMEKTLFDAMTLAGVWADDSLIADKIHLDWLEPDGGPGWVNVELTTVSNWKRKETTVLDDIQEGVKDGILQKRV